MADQQTANPEMLSPELERLLIQHPDIAGDAEGNYFRLQRIYRRFLKQIRKARLPQKDVIYNVLKLSMGRKDYDELKLAALRIALQDVKNLRPDEIKRIRYDQFPSFEYFFIDTLSGGFVSDKGRVYRMETVLPSNEIATTFVHEFAGKGAFEKAYGLENFDYSMREYMKDNLIVERLPEELQDVFRRFVVARALGIKDKYLASTFFNGRDLRRDLVENNGSEENINSLLDVSKQDLFTAFYRKLFLEAGRQDQDDSALDYSHAMRFPAEQFNGIENLIESDQRGTALKWMQRLDPGFKETEGPGSVFWNFYLGNIVDVLDKEDKYPCHGDCAPTNVIVIREKGDNGDPIKRYARVDKEGAVNDVILSQIAQLWVKSPVLNPDGTSLIDNKLGNIREYMTKELAYFMYNLENPDSIDVKKDDLPDDYLNRFKDALDKAVLREMFNWAVRYKSYVNNGYSTSRIIGEGNLNLASQYYYSLFVHEAISQGLLNADETSKPGSVLEYTNSIFGKPLTIDEMVKADARLRPKERYVSFHECNGLVRRDELEAGLLEDYKKKARINMARIGTGALLAGFITAYLAFSAINTKIKNRELKEDMSADLEIDLRNWHHEWAFEDMQRKAMLAHDVGIEPVDGNFVRLACEQEQVSYTMVNRIITEHYKWYNNLDINNEGILAGLVYLDSYYIHDYNNRKNREGEDMFGFGNAIVNPPTNIINGMKRLRRVLEEHGIDPADPYEGILESEQNNGYMTYTEESKKKQEHLKKAVFEFLYTERDKEVIPENKSYKMELDQRLNQFVLFVVYGCRDGWEMRTKRKWPEQMNNKIVPWTMEKYFPEKADSMMKKTEELNRWRAVPLSVADPKSMRKDGLYK